MILASLILASVAYVVATSEAACVTTRNDVCQFPFIYKGVSYDKCTYTETINNQPWCATVPRVKLARNGKVLNGRDVGDCDLSSNCQVEEGKCDGKPCGEDCGIGICNGDGYCVSPEENPCSQHGCGGLLCGDECLQGDILGVCDVKGYCDFDGDQALNSCRNQTTSIFNLNSDLDTSNIGACTGDGKQNCQAININNDILDNISVGDQVILLPGLDVELSLKFQMKAGSSTAFVFKAGESGDATITRGVNRISVYGSIKPGTGDVDYTIENCGDGCNVLYERDSGYFNKFDDFNVPATFLFNLNSDLDTSNIGTCTGDGKQNCQAININNDVLDNISVGDDVILLPGLDVLLSFKFQMEVGSSTAFVFKAEEFGDATITRGANRISVYGSIKPGTGDVDYTIENCGDGCNVLYERDSGYFNKFKD